MGLVLVLSLGLAFALRLAAASTVGLGELVSALPSAAGDITRGGGGVAAGSPVAGECLSPVEAVVERTAVVDEVVVAAAFGLAVDAAALVAAGRCIVSNVGSGLSR